jgi:hypothetical protein
MQGGFGHSQPYFLRLYYFPLFEKEGVRGSSRCPSAEGLRGIRDTGGWIKLVDPLKITRGIKRAPHDRGAQMISFSKLPLHEHWHHCFAVGIAILRKKDMLCQEHSRNNNGVIPGIGFNGG